MQQKRGGNPENQVNSIRAKPYRTYARPTAHPTVAYIRALSNCLLPCKYIIWHALKGGPPPGPVTDPIAPWCQILQQWADLIKPHCHVAYGNLPIGEARGRFPGTGEEGSQDAPGGVTRGRRIGSVRCGGRRVRYE